MVWGGWVWNAWKGRPAKVVALVIRFGTLLPPPASHPPRSSAGHAQPHLGTAFLVLRMYASIGQPYEAYCATQSYVVCQGTYVVDARTHSRAAL